MNQETQIKSQIDHLFRQESGKMVSVLVNIFGPEHFELAEDVVQESLMKALETWKIKGIPDQPAAWLYRVSKNKAIDLIRKEKHKRNFDFSNPTQQLLSSEYTINAAMDEYWQDLQIKDDFIGMMFACCHPDISQENQVTFILKILCGFSTQEIARSFMCSNEVISKRLHRTKTFFRKHNIRPETPSNSALVSRINAVTSCIYLIFNEGYKSAKSDTLIREDLIEQAVYLGKTLLENKGTRFSSVYALMSLMHFHWARIASRVSATGHLIALKDQDRSLWKSDYIILGKLYLQESLKGNLSTFHLEAGIANEHCSAKNYVDTNWKNILQHYDQLLDIQDDSVVRLNRCLVILEKDGPAFALLEINKLKDIKQLQDYFVYHVSLAEIYKRLAQNKLAIQHIHKAIYLTNNHHERTFLELELKKMRTGTAK